MIESEDLRNTQIVINKPTNDKVAVIVEPRRHAFLEAVVRNIMYFLPKDEWNLHIITSHDNKEWVKNYFQNGNFRVSTISQQNLNLNEYSYLLMSDFFWKNIVEENILIFQTDVMMFHNNIDDFIQYDFIGANYFDINEISVKNGGNNGGFSFRHKSAMLDCINNVLIQDVQQYLHSHGKYVKYYMSEDVYFTIACEILNKKPM
jgi:hypothetical protein